MRATLDAGPRSRSRAGDGERPGPAVASVLDHHNHRRWLSRYRTCHAPQAAQGRSSARRKEAHNKSHNQFRARVEHVFARMKTWRILRDCRLNGDGVHHAMLGIARMRDLALVG
ncbi:transposase [Streptomyces sp. NPDC004044]